MIEKRFTDIWCSETGHIGVTDCGIDREFTSDEFEDFLNELNDENDILKQQLQTRYIVNKQYEELQRLKKENEKLKKRLYLYEMDEDEVNKYLRTHPMPTIINERTITPLDMKHRW